MAFDQGHRDSQPVCGSYEVGDLAEHSTSTVASEATSAVVIVYARIPSRPRMDVSLLIIAEEHRLSIGGVIE